MSLQELAPRLARRPPTRAEDAVVAAPASVGRVATTTIVRTPRVGAERSTWRVVAGGVGRRLRWIRRLLSLVVIFAIWQIGSTRGWISPQKFPAPSEVWEAFVQLHERGELRSNLVASLGRMSRGLLLGGTLALVFGTIAGLSRVGEEIVDAPLQALRVVPNLALASLFIVWFGIGETSKIGLIALGAFFPLYLNLYSGIRNVDLRLVEAAGVFGLGRAGLARRVMLPGALPQLLVGLRQSIGVAWLSLVVVEQTNARNGIGALIIDAREFMRTDIVVAGLLIYAALGLLTDLAVRLLEKGVLSWRASFNGI